MLQNYTFIADKRGVRRSFLLFFSLFLLQVTAFAQNDVRITIRENNITVIEALKRVEKQSDTTTRCCVTNLPSISTWIKPDWIILSLPS